MSETINNILEKTATDGLSRKKFLQFTGMSTATLLTLGLIGCSDSSPTSIDDDPDKEVDLGSGDLGILNYAYAVEQLEAAFYITVLGSEYSGMSSEERQILRDLRDHEIAHRDWFRAAISSVDSDGIIPELNMNFSTVDFSSRSSVLATAQAFEDLGVSAYNGAGQLIQNPDFLVQAGKIVSVEARHASAIRSIIASSNTAFAGNDIIDGNGLEMTRTPSQVLSIAQSFFDEQISGSNLPEPQ